MSYELFRESLLECWPGEFLTEGDILDYLFFSGVRFLKWVDGELTDGRTHEQRLSTALKARDPGKTADDLREEEEAYRHASILVNKKSGYPTIWFYTKSGGLGKRVRISANSAAVNFPEDISPNWLEALERAVTWAKSKNVTLDEDARGILNYIEHRMSLMKRIHQSGFFPKFELEAIA